MATTIRHACGHEVEYARAKDKATMAARPCPRCEHEARQARPTPADPVYCVERPHAGCREVVIVRAGGLAAAVAAKVVEFPGDSPIATRWESYPTRAAAEARVREMAAAGVIEFVEDQDPEGSAAVARTMGLMAEVDRAERPGPVPCERSRAAALDRAGADPDDEREIDLIFDEG